MEIQNDVKNLVAGVLFSQSKGAYKLEESEQLAPIVRRVVDWANNNYAASVVTEPVLPQVVPIPQPSDPVPARFAQYKGTPPQDSREEEEESMSRTIRAKPSVSSVHATSYTKLDTEEDEMRATVVNTTTPVAIRSLTSDKVVGVPPSQSTMNYAPASPTIYNAANLSNSIETISLPSQ